MSGYGVGADSIAGEQDEAVALVTGCEGLVGE
jgi:hypothetical protein